MVNDGGWKDGVVDWTEEAGKTASVAAIINPSVV
jgi:hypothetical protein